jgi:predicted DNA-binding transcriptional regulator AlpA
MKFIDAFEVARMLDMRTSQVQRLVAQRVLPQPILFGPRIERWEQRQFELHLRQMVQQQRRRDKG